MLGESFDFKYKPRTPVYPRLRPDEVALRRAIGILREANRPVILVGSSVTRCEALDEVVQFGELIGARVYQGWMSDVNFPVSHPQYLGDLDPTSPKAKGVFRNVDVLVGIGCPMFAQGFYNPEKTLPEGVKIIRVDEDPWQIGKNFLVDCGIQGDIKVTLAELNELIKKDMPSNARKEAASRAKEIAAEKSELHDQLKRQAEEEKDRVPISISRLMTEIKKAMTPDTVMVDDCWSSSAMLTGENFRSRTLNREFDRIYFVSRGSRNGEVLEPAPAGAGGMTMAGSHGAGEAAEAPAPLGAPVDPAPGGLRVADVWAKRAALSGTTVTVRARVVKANYEIMGVNWYHLQDGSGAETDGTNDLTITSDAQARVGDVVTISGTLVTNKDFGAGYAYSAIVEKASIKK